MTNHSSVCIDLAMDSRPSSPGQPFVATSSASRPITMPRSDSVVASFSPEPSPVHADCPLGLPRAYPPLVLQCVNCFTTSTCSRSTSSEPGSVNTDFFPETLPPSNDSACTKRVSANLSHRLTTTMSRMFQKYDAGSISNSSARSRDFLNQAHFLLSDSLASRHQQSSSPIALRESTPAKASNFSTKDSQSSEPESKPRGTPGAQPLNKDVTVATGMLDKTSLELSPITKNNHQVTSKLPRYPDRKDMALELKDNDTETTPPPSAASLPQDVAHRGTNLRTLLREAKIPQSDSDDSFSYGRRPAIAVDMWQAAMISTPRDRLRNADFPNWQVYSGTDSPFYQHLVVFLQRPLPPRASELRPSAEDNSRHLLSSADESQEVLKAPPPAAKTPRATPSNVSLITRIANLHQNAAKSNKSSSISQSAFSLSNELATRQFPVSRLPTGKNAPTYVPSLPTIQGRGARNDHTDSTKGSSKFDSPISEASPPQQVVARGESTPPF
ncbi:hypothetical protein H4Q26_001412 [Puccinia striiformis f. sp. tritici PST-130]|nr:hypothetical protein H4Q26_001412 [Puccinia striiformis f. sp. tritici PST-130]